MEIRYFTQKKTLEGGLTKEGWIARVQSSLLASSANSNGEKWGIPKCQCGPVVACIFGGSFLHFRTARRPKMISRIESYHEAVG
jgi:hypothetical protein